LSFVDEGFGTAWASDLRFARSRQLDAEQPEFRIDRDPTGTVETDVVPPKKSARGGSTACKKDRLESET
jgi:hypothetical protein